MLLILDVYIKFIILWIYGIIDVSVFWFYWCMCIVIMWIYVYYVRMDLCVLW